MATTDITITVDNEQLRQIRHLVAEKQTASVSAFLKHAVGIALHDAAGWKQMLASALEETGGPLTNADGDGLTQS